MRITKSLSRGLLLSTAATLALPVLTQPSFAQGVVLDQITVQARKREESLLDVPVAASAFTAEQLQLEEIDSVDDLIQRTPGVDFARIGSPFADQVSVRGQGGGRQINAETATGLYRSGAFIAGGNVGGSTFSRMDLFDVQSVEAFRGPQGASFGRNALGGAVNIVSQTPGEAFEARGSVEYGSNDRIEIEGILNMPLNEEIATRFGVYKINQEDGFYFNSFLNDVADDEELLGIRGSVSYTPSATFDAVLMAEYFDESTPSFVPRPHIDGTNPFLRSYNLDSRFDRDEYFLHLEMNQEFDFATLTSLTYYKHRNVRTIDDLDAQQGQNLGAFGNFVRIADDEFTRYGQELRLASNTDGRLNWVIGAEVLRLEDDYFQNFSGIPLPLGNSIVNSESRDWNYAVFGLLGFDITPQLNIAGELRFSYDDKEIDLVAVNGPGTMSQVTTAFSASEQFDNVSPVVTLTYKPRSNLTGYLRYSTGFRAGGFNLTPDPIPPEEFSLVYDPEEATNYEAGVKASLFDNRANIAVAAFYAEGEDVLINDQLTIGTFPNSRNINFVVNGGETEFLGVEVDASGVLEVPRIGGELRVNSSASWTESAFTESINFVSATGRDLTGFSVPFVRKYTASVSSTYRRPVMNTDVDLILVHSWRGQWGGKDSPTPGTDKEDLSLHDLRASLDTENWRITGALENVFDNEFNITVGQNTVVQNDPQTWSVEVTLKF